MRECHDTSDVPEPLFVGICAAWIERMCLIDINSNAEYLSAEKTSHSGRRSGELRALFLYTRNMYAIC